MKTALVVIFMLLTLPLAAQENAGKALNEKKEPAEKAGAGTVYIIDCGLRVYPRLPVISCSVYDAYPKPDFNNHSSHILMRADIAQMPAAQVTDMLAVFPGVYQSQRGSDVSVLGSRISGSLYVIDGMQVMR